MRGHFLLNNKVAWTSILLCALWILGNLFLWREHQREKNDFLEKFVERSQDIGLTIESLVVPMARAPGGNKKQIIQRALHDLTKFGQFKSLALVNHDGEVMVSEPPLTHLAINFSQEGTVIYNPTDNTYAVVTPLNIGQFNEDQKFFFNREHDALPPELQRKLDDWRARRETKGQDFWRHQMGLHQFVTIISGTQLQQQLRKGDQLRVWISIATLLAFMAVMAIMERHRRMVLLKVDLDKKEILNTELQEKNLAAAGLAHETRTPLGIVRGLAQLQCEDDSLSKKAQERATLMVEEVDRITSRLNDFIEYSRMREPVLVPMDLHVLFKRLHQIFNDDLQDAQLKLEFPQHSLPKILGDSDMLQQVFFNLIHNAILMCPSGAFIRLAYEVQGVALNCSVEDSGPGIPEDMIDHLFKPYVTRRTNGTGLGLAVVRQICHCHGVQIRFENVPSGGARFMLSGFKLAPTI